MKRQAANKKNISDIKAGQWTGLGLGKQQELNPWWLPYILVRRSERLTPGL